MVLASIQLRKPRNPTYTVVTKATKRSRLRALSVRGGTQARRYCGLEAALSGNKTLEVSAVGET